ncbi:MAG: hypothetical protein MHMPM18_000810 [Marteilia pararefringens]
MSSPASVQFTASQSSGCGELEKQIDEQQVVSFSDGCVEEKRGRASSSVMQQSMSRISRLDELKRKMGKYLDERVEDSILDESKSNLDTSNESLLLKFKDSKNKIEHDFWKDELLKSSPSILSIFHGDINLFSRLDGLKMIKNINNIPNIPDTFRKFISCLFSPNFDIKRSTINMNPCDHNNFNEIITKVLCIVNRSMLECLSAIKEGNASNLSIDNSNHKRIYQLLIIINKFVTIEEMKNGEQEVLMNHLFFHYIDKKLRQKSSQIIRSLVEQIFEKNQFSSLLDFPSLLCSQFPYVINNLYKTAYLKMIFTNRPHARHESTHSYYTSVLRYFGAEIMERNCSLVSINSQSELLFAHPQNKLSYLNQDKNSQQFYDLKKISINFLEFIESKCISDDRFSHIILSILYMTLSLIIIALSLNGLNDDLPCIVGLHRILKKLVSRFRDSLTLIDYTIMKDEIFCLIYLLETSFDYFNIEQNSFLSEFHCTDSLEREKLRIMEIMSQSSNVEMINGKEFHHNLSDESSDIKEDLDIDLPVL